MTVGHRTNRLKLVGIPEVEQLQNGRYQLTVNCTPLNKREDWYNSNKSRIFPDFGSLQSAEMSIDGLAPRTGEAYTDMGLVSVQSRSQGDDYIVTLVYQTLGSSFVQVKDDTVELTESGLRKVTRVSIAQAGTDIPTDDKDIGSDFITHQIDAESAVTCFLTSFKVDDTDSFREFTRNYLEAGILSVEQDFDNGRDKVIVRAFNKTSSAVTSDLSEVTSNHKLLSQKEDNFAGIKTSVYEYEVDNFEVIDTDENNLQKKIVTDYSASTFSAGTIGTTTSGALLLGNEEIDNGGTIKVRRRIFYTVGTLSVSSRNLSEGVKEVTTTFLGTEGSTTGPIVRRSQNNSSGLKTISVANLQDRSGNSLVASDPNLVHTYEQLVNFKFPGVVSISTSTVGNSSDILVTNAFFDLKPPITKKVQAQVNVFFQTESKILPDDFTYDISQGLWNPTTWAKGLISGVGTNFALTTGIALSETKGFVGYTSGTPTSQPLTGGTGTTITAIEGKFILPNTSGAISVGGGPGIPSGKYVLDVKIVPAFEDVNGVLYFKKTIVTATV